ncbi:hypothetical protein WIS52_22005 [Pseudonocardia nematodicida]|uniref:Uncharacterized protein n=1 Tax=Pseudonocardia nematodicida TaxID=1206997 RepID=A0ABV1KFB5_9PSEU
MTEFRVPAIAVPAVVLVLGGLALLLTLPPAASLVTGVVVAGAAVAGAWSARWLGLGPDGTTAAVRAAAVALVVVGGPILAAVQLGARSVPLLMAAGAVAVLAAPLLPGLLGADVTDRRRPDPGTSPGNCGATSR